MPRSTHAGMHQPPQGRGRGRFGRLVPIVAAALGAAAFAAPAQAELALTGPIDPLTGVPAWYEDTNGMQLELCTDEPGFCPTTALSAADGESFWSVVGAALTGPDGQSFNIGFDLEAADLGTPGPISFSRIQVLMEGVEPNGEYTFTHPYGTGTWTASADGTLLGGRASAQRQEVGCAPPPPGAQCDFDAILATTIGPYLTWDPAQSLPPDGFIGDGVTPHRVVGSPLGRNSVTVEGPGLPAGGITTDEFVVEGRLARPPTPIFFAAPGSGDFGTQRVGTTTTRTVTVKNNGLAAMPAFTGAAITGADAGSFATGADTCSGATLASGASCTVDVAFSPAASGARSASLDLSDAGGGTSSVPLSGTGGTSGVSTSPAVVDFLNQNVGTTSPERTVTVRNTGPVSLNVTGVSVGGANAREFAVSSNACTTPVPAGGSCTVGVRFLPTASGVRNASLVVASDAPGSPHSTPLTGNGTVPAGGAATGAAQPASTGGSGSAAGLFTQGGGGSLALDRLATTSRIKQSRARSVGLRLVMRLQEGTEVVRVRIYRRLAGGKRKLLSSGFRSTGGKSGLFRMRQNHRSLRRSLTPGRYVVEVTPGATRTDLGRTSRYNVRVVR